MRRPLRILALGGLFSIPFALFAAVALVLSPTTVNVSPQPLSGNWSCSSAGAPIGMLSVDGWNYVLGSTEMGKPVVGTFELVDYPPYSGEDRRFATKYHEAVLKVRGGTLSEQFGVKLGFHFKIAGEPERLAFSIGPGAGISCSRA